MLKRIFISLALLLPFSSSSRATNVDWYSGVGDVFLLSNGVTLLDENFSFELGGFQSGFTPTTANLSLWESNWVSFDLANFSNGGWNPMQDFSNYGGNGTTVAAGVGFVSSVDTGAIFSIGQQAYLWTYNTKQITGTTEWALVTNPTWTMPAASDPSGPPTSVTWTLDQTNNVAVVGEVNPDPNTFSTLQTQAVPEPGSALMILAAGIVFRLRRRLTRN